MIHPRTSFSRPTAIAQEACVDGKSALTGLYGRRASVRPLIGGCDTDSSRQGYQPRLSQQRSFLSGLAASRQRPPVTTSDHQSQRMIGPFSATVLVFLLLARGPDQAHAADSLEAIVDDFWQWRMKEFPEFSSFAGEDAYDDKLETYSIATYEQRYSNASQFSKRLASLDRSTFNAEQELNFKMLSSAINDNYIAGYKWMRRVAVNPGNYLEGVSVDEMASLLTPKNASNLKDYTNLLDRLEAYPNQTSQHIQLMREAIRTSMTNHNVSMIRIAANINASLSTPIANSRFYQAFGSSLDNVTSISSEEKVNMRSRAVASIGRIYDSLRNFSAFVTQEFIPKARTFYGVSEFPEGSEFYQACLKWHTTTDLTADAIHKMGLNEVDRIRKNMEKTMKEANFSGTLHEFQEHLRNDSQFYFNTKEELLQEYKNLIKFVDEKLSPIFGADTMPNVPCIVEEMKTDGPGGQYSSPMKPGDPGRFIVNLNQPNKRAKFSMMALTLHEANPGHHYQSVAQLNAPGLPPFRRYTEYSKYYTVPFHFPFQTAYAEGWALYAESLGEEIQVYRTPYERFGRYSSEIFRAARLVVDTGLHAFKWTRQQAIEYMMNTTFDVREQIENEIDRYITWPGQACAYKIGELKIKELRARAEEAFGASFDVKQFHSQVLHLGSVPLTILEEYVDKWICTKTGKRCVTSGTTSVHVSLILTFGSLFLHIFRVVICH